jgi:CheY-like chemotaxis protein
MPRAHAKRIELVSDLDPRIPQYFMGDPHRMRQVLNNLIGNAVKFTSTGDVVVAARLEAVGDGTYRVRIGVRDTGIGIPAEHLKDIFEPFRQVDTSTTRVYGGTGLGLSIARGLIQMMRGDLQVTSTHGVGTDFFFTLEFAAGPSVSATSAGETALDGVRALVVDDHPTSRRATAEMLKWGGCIVDEAENVAGAMEAIANASADKVPYSLIVADAQLPGEGGFALAARVRSIPSLDDTRMMILTTAGQKGDGERCRGLGVSAYMHKPVSRVELLEATVAALAEIPGAAQAERAALVTRHSIGAARRQLRVLLVEDNRINQVVASSLLQKRGHLVQIANHGREALDAIFGGAPFDVVLMDMQMPVLDGIEATRMIRAKGNMRLRIVALTANVSIEERDRCAAAGMNDYLSKPYKSHQLFAVVEGWAGSGEHAIVEPRSGGL